MRIRQSPSNGVLVLFAALYAAALVQGAGVREAVAQQQPTATCTLGTSTVCNRTTETECLRWEQNGTIGTSSSYGSRVCTWEVTRERVWYWSVDGSGGGGSPHRVIEDIE